MTDQVVELLEVTVCFINYIWRANEGRPDKLPATDFQNDAINN